MKGEKKERIYRELFAHDRFNLTLIAKESGLSPSMVHREFKKLKEKEIITDDHVVDYIELLREWAEYKRVIFKRKRPIHLDILIPERIKGMFKEYAVSGEFAESLLYGQTPGMPMILYLKDEKVKPSRKGNVIVYYYDEHIFKYTTIVKGFCTVFTPQICADLMARGMYGDVAIDLLKRWLSAHR